MAKNTFDRVLSSAPANATAAKVMSSGEEVWVSETQMPPGYQHWTEPPAMRPFRPIHNPHSGVSVDITGRKFGRFTIVGVLAEKGGKSRGERWVCRCACGSYEPRSIGAIAQMLAGLQGSDSVVGRCWHCAQLKITQARYKKNGSRPLSDFVESKARIIDFDRGENTPEFIIAGCLSAMSEEAARLVALEIIAALNRADFRVSRAPAGSTTIRPGDNA